MYTVQTYDILSRTVKAISISRENHETNGALENIKKLELKSITLYDRGFSNNKIMKAHFDEKNHFFIRFKSGKSIPVEMKKFWKSNLTKDSFLLQGNSEHRVYLFKVKKKKETHIYATSFKNLTVEEAESLYRLRWEVENSFCDMVKTLPVEQWHSKSENGVLQELYVRLWIMNYTRIQQFLNEKPIKNPLARIYTRSNFKLILDFVINHWEEFFRGKRKYLQKIKQLIQCSTEKRKRYSRSRKRQLRYQNKNYSAANIIFDHEVKMA